MKIKKLILQLVGAGIAVSGILLILSKLVFEALSNIKSKAHFLLGNEESSDDGNINEIEFATKNILSEKDLYLETRDNKKLHGKLIMNVNNTDLYAWCIHGYLTSGNNELKAIINNYLELGANVIITDQRAFGESEGVYSTFGSLESRDHMEWLRLLENEILNNNESSKIIIHGISMGAATTLLVCRNELPSNIKGIIAEGSYTSLKEQLVYTLNNKAIAEKYFKKQNSFYAKVVKVMPAKFIYFLYQMACFNRSIFDPQRTRPIDGAAKISGNMPVIFVHGKKDKFVPYTMSQEMYLACESLNKKLLIVDDAQEGQCFEKSSEYRDVIQYIVNKLL